MFEGMHATIIRSWIAAANAFDRQKYLGFFTDDAVLDDPSVGRIFKGKAGVGEYFDAYFVGYCTRTRVVSISPEGSHWHVAVHFTGEFPEGEVDGIFDVTFRGDAIASVKAELV